MISGAPLTGIKKSATPSRSSDSSVAPPAGNDDTASFEDALKDLERIVSQLESGTLGLEQSLAEYEKGVRRLRQCHQKLEAFERKIEILTGFDATGETVTDSFDENQATLEEKQANRGVRRSAKRGPASEAGGLF